MNLFAKNLPTPYGVQDDIIYDYVRFGSAVFILTPARLQASEGKDSLWTPWL